MPGGEGQALFLMFPWRSEDDHDVLGTIGMFPPLLAESVR